MTSLSTLKPFKGARKRSKRIGIGQGSGHGGSATRGMKGQRSRSGDGKLIGFEGGQMPLARRLPKHGFHNPFRTEYAVVNLESIERAFDDATEVSLEALRERGLAKASLPVKILGDGEFKKARTVSANAFSASAKEKIEKAGGKAVVIELKRPTWKRQAKKAA